MSDSVKRRARILALEALYEWDTSGHDPEVVYNRRLSEVAAEDRELAAPKAAEFGRAMLLAVVARHEELDRYIGEAATRFPVESLAVVDRNILRLAVWELLSDNSAPVAAVVNEAVELAHRYGGESSPPFINGVLGTISATITGSGGAARRGVAGT